MAMDFLAGCAGGAAGVIVGHPLDTVKVRLQTQNPNNIKYRGTFHTLSTIVKEESVYGLYKGIASPLLGVAGINAIVFGVYGLLRPFVTEYPGQDALWAHFAAGSISGSVQSFICSPMELVKIRLQVNDSKVSKATSWDVFKNIYKNEGGLFRGVYKGWLCTLCREIPGFGSYFATYELLTTKTGHQVGTFGMMMAGGMAGVASWLCSFPIDVVKTRLQMDSSNQYSGIFDCVRKTFQNEGYKPFFRGLNSAIIRAFPTNAATFTVVNWIMRFLDSKQDDIQKGRENLHQLLQEWDIARLNSKKPHIYYYCNNCISNNSYWTRRVPSYNYLSAKPLLPQSSATSTIQLIEDNLKKMNSLLNFENPEICENEQLYEKFVSRLEPAESKPGLERDYCYFSYTSNSSKKISMPGFSSATETRPGHPLSSSESDTLVVSKSSKSNEIVIQYRTKNPSIHDLVRELLLFTSIEQKTCEKCVYNCKCSI